MVPEEDLVLGDVKVLEEDASTCEVEVLNADNDALDGEEVKEVKEVKEGSPPAGSAGTSSGSA